jgi:protein ImuA
MQLKKADIITQLKKDILLLQGCKYGIDNTIQIKLGSINDAFPDGHFPLGAIHEFINEKVEYAAAAKGFISYLVSALMKAGGPCIWICPTIKVFPPSLKSFDLEPDRIIFVNVQREKDILWVIEEALKCDGIAAVIAEVKEINFLESRRLQLAVEKSHVTGFIIRDQPQNIGVNACVSRWKISPLPSSAENKLPGIGFPRWNIELLKIRNGKPGAWIMEWSYGKLHPVSEPKTFVPQEERKTG